MNTKAYLAAIDNHPSIGIRVIQNPIFERKVHIKSGRFSLFFITVGFIHHSLPMLALSVFDFGSKYCAFKLKTP
jgi:hypothetical protein